MALKVGARHTINLVYTDEAGEKHEIVIRARRPSAREWMEYADKMTVLVATHPIPVKADGEEFTLEDQLAVRRRNLAVEQIFYDFGRKVLVEVVEGIEMADEAVGGPVTQVELLCDEYPKIVQMVGIHTFSKAGNVEDALGKSETQPDSSSQEASAESTEQPASS